MSITLGDRLRIKYGLTSNPSDDQIARWRGVVEVAIAAGEDPEDAGRSAALDIFGELDRVLLFSEADTIKSLLARAREK